MEPAAIREALATAFRYLPGLNEGDRLQTYAKIPDQFQSPCAVILGPEIDYEQTLGGAMMLCSMRAVFYVGSPDSTAAQDLLDRYLATTGPYSPVAMLRADPTLGGTVGHARITGNTNYGIYMMGGARYLGTEFLIPVYVADTDLE